MPGITLETAQAHLDNWIAADLAVSSNQSYSINGRSLTRTDAKEIRENINYWNEWVEKLAIQASGRRGPRYIVGPNP